MSLNSPVTPVTPTWTAEILYSESKNFQKEDPETGEISYGRSRKITVLLKKGDLRLEFPVSRRNNKLSFTDNRETLTGACPGSRLGRAYTKPGPKKVLSQISWIQEVTRLIGKIPAENICDELLYG